MPQKPERRPVQPSRESSLVWLLVVSTAMLSMFIVGLALFNGIRASAHAMARSSTDAAAQAVRP